MERALRGEVIEAIKITRTKTGLSLLEAKNAIEAALADTRSPPARRPPNANRGNVQIPPDAVAALRKGVLIEAIKHTRVSTGLGLKDAKETVERYLEQNPAVRSKFKAASAETFKRTAGTVVLILLALGLAVIAYLYAAGQAH